MQLGVVMDADTGASSATHPNVSEAVPAIPGKQAFAIGNSSVHNASHVVKMGPFEWHEENGQFVDDGIVVTGIIIAGVILMVVCFCAIHMLRYMGFCWGMGQRRNQSVTDEYREYRQERLNDMYAHMGGHRAGSGAERPSPGPQARYSRLSSHPAMGTRDRYERGSSSALGMNGRRNPQAGRLTYIRFSPSGIRYTNQSILMPSSGVRRHHPERVPVLPRGGRTQPVDVEGDRRMGGPLLSSFSPWTDSMAGSSFVSQGGNGEMASGDLGPDGVPLSVGSRSEDLEASVRDSALGALDAAAAESARARDRALADAAAAEAARQKIAELFNCPITHEIMEDPVMAADGYTYERTAIMKWLKTHRRSPMTNEPMVEIVLIANHGLKSAIQEWRASNEVTVD